MEREFSLKEVLSYVIDHMMKIVCIALAIMLIVGSIGVYFSYNQSSTEFMLMSEDIAKKNYALLRKELDELNEYAERSIYYSLNALDKAESTITGYVDTGYEIMPDKTYQSPDMTAAVVSMFAIIADTDAEIIEGVKGILDMKDVEDRFIKELYSVSKNNDPSNNLRGYDGFFKISVSYSDETKAQEICAFVLDKLLEKSKVLMIDYETRIIVNATNYVIDEKLLTYQRDTIKRLAQLNVDVDEAETMLLSFGNEEDKSVAKSVVKYGAIGLVLGVALACILLLVQFLANGKVNTANDVLQRFPYQVVAVFPPVRQRIPHTLAIGMQGYNIESPTPDAAYNLIAANLQGAQGTTIVVGSCGTEALREVVNELSGRVDVKISVAGNILNDYEAVLSSKNADNVLVVEKIGRSRVRDIELQINKVKAMGKNIIGFVLLP